MSETTHASNGHSEGLLAALLACSPDGVVFVDRGGKIREWSSGAARIYGYSRPEILGQDVSMLRSDGTPSAETTAVAEADAETADDERLTVRRRKDGRLISVSLQTRPVFAPDGGVIGTLKLVKDLTSQRNSDLELLEREHALRQALHSLRRSHEELKSTQMQLLQSAKLESVGRLAAGVAHEVKNPLAILLTGLQLLRKQLPNCEAPVAQTLEDLETAVKRANGIIHGLLDFAASSELRLEPVGLEDVVSASIKLVHHMTQKERVQVVREQMESPPNLRLDHIKVEQVLVNLMINAIHAMEPEGGTLTVRTSVRRLAEPGPDVGYRKTDVFRVGETVAVIEIEDTGPGIPPEVLGRLFDPFFTTKTAGKGAGLGLAVSRTIIGLHRGAIRIDNRPEGGARSTVMLRAGEQERG